MATSDEKDSCTCLNSRLTCRTTTPSTVWTPKDITLTLKFLLFGKKMPSTKKNNENVYPKRTPA